MYQREPSRIIEIGPGKGALTGFLLRGGAEIQAIELDPAMGEILRGRFGSEPRFHLLMADVLEVDLAQWGTASLAGNLPYYITSPILERIFAAKAAIGRAVVLVQLEVAHRLAAKPGSRDYGYLTVVTQSQASVKIVCRVPASAFRPPPKVESAVVTLDLFTEKDPQLAEFLVFAGKAFRHKRKTLRNNLITAYPAADQMGLPELAKRAEQLSIEELRALWRRLEDGISGTGKPGLVSCN